MRRRRPRRSSRYQKVRSEIALATLLLMNNSEVPGGVVHELPDDLRETLIASAAALDACKDITSRWGEVAPERAKVSHMAPDVCTGVASRGLSRSNPRGPSWLRRCRWWSPRRGRTL